MVATTPEPTGTTDNKRIALPVLAGVVCLATLARTVTLVIWNSLHRLDLSSMPTLVSVGVATLAMLVALWFLGMRGILRARLSDFRDALRIGWLPLCLTAVASVTEAVLVVSQGAAPLPVSVLPRAMIEVALTYLLLALYEETLFRGVLFKGLLQVVAGEGDGKADGRVTLFVAVVASVAFGFSHLATSPIDFSAGLAVMSVSVLRVVHTALYSMMLCTMVARTDGIVAIALYHAFDNLLLKMPETVLGMPATLPTWAVLIWEAVAIACCALVVARFASRLTEDGTGGDGRPGEGQDDGQCDGQDGRQGDAAAGMGVPETTNRGSKSRHGATGGSDPPGLIKAGKGSRKSRRIR